MARVGFKKVFAAETFDKDSVAQLFGYIKTAVIDAGFNVLLDTETAIDFIRMGSPAGTADDDTPHWAFEYMDYGDSTEILAYPVFGNDFQDADARTHGYSIVHSNSVNVPSPEVTLWFAADAVAGWWWLHGQKDDPYSATGKSAVFASAGTTSQRFPSDTYQGLCTRYGLRNVWGEWRPAYAVQPNGEINTEPGMSTWSAFGGGDSFNGQRHAGSPLAKMAVPLYPCHTYGSLSACIFGAINEILVLTDGYASEEIVVPGWIAMTGNEWEQPYAVPMPDQFSKS